MKAWNVTSKKLGMFDQTTRSHDEYIRTPPLISAAMIHCDPEGRIIATENLPSLVTPPHPWEVTSSLQYPGKPYIFAVSVFV